MLQAFLVLAAALFSVGLFGALSQQSVVMIMMGLELMLAGVIVAGAALWWFLAPGRMDLQIGVLVVITAMTVEMAMGFAAALLLYRAADKDMTDMVAEFSG